MNVRLIACLMLPLVCGMFGLPVTASAQDESGRVVQFARDIAPIFARHCLECHDAENSKGGFQIDDADTVSGYLEAGDAAGSVLFTEYLMTDDEDMLMPPPSHGGPLSPAELALVRVWIDEGAEWPETATVGIVEEGASETPPAPVAAPRSLVGRVWAFQGFFHPATVHFPIALLLVGGLFVVVGWFHPVLGDHVALTCLFLGALSAVIATAMGWSFATQQGYGGWAKVDFQSTVFWHRWSGVIVTLLAVLTAFAALRAIGSNNTRLKALWKLGLLVCAALIGLVGHQGGDLTYGESHYQRAFKILLDSPGTPVESADAPAPPGEESATEPLEEASPAPSDDEE